MCCLEIQSRRTELVLLKSLTDTCAVKMDTFNFFFPQLESAKKEVVSQMSCLAPFKWTWRCLCCKWVSFNLVWSVSQHKHWYTHSISKQWMLLAFCNLQSKMYACWDCLKHLCWTAWKLTKLSEMSRFRLLQRTSKTKRDIFFTLKFLNFLNLFIFRSCWISSGVTGFLEQKCWAKAGYTLNTVTSLLQGHTIAWTAPM